MHETSRHRLLLAASVAVILMLTLMPVRGYRGHAHWDRVQWVPFADRQLPPLQAAANVVLFVPFGWAVAVVAGRHWGFAIPAAALLSVGVEAVQVFAHGRFPTTTDVALNVAGAALGALLTRRC